MPPLSARVVTDIGNVDPTDWDGLEHDGDPFVSHGFLQALESSGSVCPESGWQPHHLALYEGGRLVAFAPTYLKAHSHGEFVFDWAWADAYQRYGHAYYPKLLTAVPYSPVPGPRLLVAAGHPDPAALRAALVSKAIETCEELNLSSWHCNFFSETDRTALRRDPLLARHDWQFHWFNAGYRSFDEFLASLRSKKRKNMRRDRRLVADAGIRLERRAGGELSEAERDFVYACYQQTFLEHGNHPALTADFFNRLSTTMPEAVMVALALREGRPIAMSWFLQGGGTLYGRYWGCIEQHAGLHFETAYHQGIEHCIERGLKVFQPGAQGEHKMSRGFVATQTRSAHLVRDPVFRRAIAAHLEREDDWLDQYREELEAHQPFRRDGTDRDRP
ncbi:GNAT family N-acetyltransferase [Elongatibacter sediminis]|uniref:GNAT family N-acetyltransferase n=1 Tax=Elongatibacter sediminis TaxID=3119006 RepID=A0AAW9R784_9GAMM